MKNYKIINAEEYDADIVAIMVHKLMQEIYSEDEIANPADIIHAARTLMEDKEIFTAILAFDNVRKPVGVLAMVEAASLHAVGRYGIITEFYVDPEERSKGLGDQMLVKAMDIGKSKKWSRIDLIFPKSATIRLGENFLKRQGFQNAGPSFRLYL